MDKSEALEALEQARFHINQLRRAADYPGGFCMDPIAPQLKEIVFKLQEELKELESQLNLETPSTTGWFSKELINQIKAHMKRNE